MSIYDSPINKLKMMSGIDPQIMAALQRINPVATGNAMGQVPQPGGPVKGPSFFDRLGSHMMPTPQPLVEAGLLNDEDLSAARGQGLLGLGASLLADSGPKTAENYVGLGPALGRGIQAMQSGYQGAVQSAANMRGSALNYKEQKEELDRRGQLRTARTEIVKKYPMPDVGTPGAMSQWIDTVLPHFIEANDEETVGRLSEIRKSLDNNQQFNRPKFDTLDTGGELIDRMVMPDGTIRELGRTKKTATPNTLLHGELMTPAARDRAEQNIIGEFDRQSKDYVKAHEAWTQVQHVVDRARSNTHSPDDIVQLLDGISRLNNPGAVVRTGTVQLQLNKIGSASDKLRMYLARGAKGTWPSDVIEGIGRAAREIAREHERQFNDLRKRAIARGNRIGLNYMDDVLPNTWADSITDTPVGGNWHPPMALPGQIDPRLQGIPRKGQ